MSLLERSSLYRQWRPRRFDEVVGQEHVVTTLQNAVRRDQVAHAYIFAGPRGTGKTTVARLLAKIVNCSEHADDSHTAEPCNACEQCLAIDSGSSMNMIEVDAASHRGIDDIRELQEKVPYAATSGRFRVYILDEAHMLTTEAFNALLKTLEEPPDHVIFILATTEPHKIPVTVQSRCQRFDYRFLTADEIAERLRKVVAADDNLVVTEPAVWTISLYSEGAVRDALGLLEQCRDFAEDEVSEEAVRQVIGAVSRHTLVEYARHLLHGDIAGVMDLIDGVSMAGADIGQFIRDLLSLARDMLLYRASDGARQPIMPEEDLHDMREVAEQFALPQLLHLVDQLAAAEDRSRYSAQPRFLLEMSSIRLAGEFGRERHEQDAPARAAVRSPAAEVDDAPDEEDDAPPGRSVAEDDVDTPDCSRSDDIEEMWEKVKEIIREASLPTHALLQPARPGGVSDGAFILVFGDQYQFHRDRTEREGRHLLQQAIKEVAGEDLAVRCVMESDYSRASDDEGSRSSREDEPEQRRDNRMNSAEEAGGADEGSSSSSLRQHDDEAESTDGGSVVREDESPVVDKPADEVASMFSGKVVGKLSEMDIPDGDDDDEDRNNL